jgi:hypothetical protein
MPRAKWGATTDFALYLQDYMWSKRPPLTPGQLAYKVGFSPQTISGWLNGGRIPPPAHLAVIAEKLSIPLHDLYVAAGIPIPEPPPAPRDHDPLPVVDMAAQWERVIADVVAVLRADGVAEPAIQQVVAHIRDRQFGTDRERHVLAEFAPPAPETVVDGIQAPQADHQRAAPS